MASAIELQRAFGYLFEEEIPALESLITVMGADVLQIGAGAGTSSLAILASPMMPNLTTIDITDSDSPFGCLYAERKVVAMAGFSPQLNQLHGDSKDIVPNLSDTYDLCFIDGDHSYEGCKTDIENCLKYALVKGGIIAVHDYKKEDAYDNVIGKAPHPKSWPGVTRAVDELLVGKYKQVLHVRSLIAFKTGK